MWTHRVFFLYPPGEPCDWLPVTSSLRVRGLGGRSGAPPSPNQRAQRQTARPNPSHHRAGPHCAARSKFNINEVAHWLSLASIPLRDFCGLADFLQYYFWGSRVKVLKMLPIHNTGMDWMEATLPASGDYKSVYSQPRHTPVSRNTRQVWELASEGTSCSPNPRSYGIHAIL